MIEGLSLQSINTSQQNLARKSEEIVFHPWVRTVRTSKKMSGEVRA